MERNINEIGINQILPLFICKSLSDSMRQDILENTYTYKYLADDIRGIYYYTFLTQNKHELAEIVSRNELSAMIMGFDDTNTFELTKYDKPKHLIVSSKIKNKIKEIDKERYLELQEILLIMKNLLNDEFYERTKQFAYFTTSWKTPKKHLVFSKHHERLITIQFCEDTSSYKVVYLNKEFYKDLI
ncbi:MAG: hypothetical protein ACRDDE_10230 [Paraclostridium sp.]|uniref:hypothetical protein n=1 Tax=Paraclostridium sp. TaxID=2023273 RepID=UPI003EE5C21C